MYVRKLWWDRARVINHVFFCSHLLYNGIFPTANATTCSNKTMNPLTVPVLAYHLPHVTFFSLPVRAVGRGGGGRREFHHTMLHPNGWRGLPHPDGDAGHLLPRGPISQRLDHQAPQTSHLRPRHLPCHGVSHQSLLPGWHTGRPQGKDAAGQHPFFCLSVLARGSRN